MYDFTYHRPASLADAVKALAGSSDSKLIAGGMTLVPTLKQRLANPADLIDLAAIAELKGIKVDGTGVTIGAMTTHGEVAHSAEVQKAIPGFGRAGGADRRPSGPQPRDHRGIDLQQRSGRRLSRRPDGPRCDGSDQQAQDQGR